MIKLRIIKFTKVQSTNNVALTLIKIKNSKPTLITSLLQTKGRGTMGKNWISKRGNLFISIFFEINQKKINFRQYAILNAYFFKNIITRFIKKEINIKWPNDLLVGKEKICGILQEVVNFNAKSFLITGVGINTNSFPLIKNYKATSISSILGKEINNNEILKKIHKDYEIFITQNKKYSFTELKRKLLKNK